MSLDILPSSSSHVTEGKLDAALPWIHASVRQLHYTSLQHVICNAQTVVNVKSSHTVDNVLGFECFKLFLFFFTFTRTELHPSYSNIFHMSCASHLKSICYIFRHDLHTASFPVDLRNSASHSSWEICDAAAKPWYNGCLFTKPNHTLPLTQPCTFSSVHPKGAIHCVRDVKYNQPTNPPVQGSPSTPTLTPTHKKKSVGATWLDTPFRLYEQRELSVSFQLRCPLARHRSLAGLQELLSGNGFDLLQKYILLQCCIKRSSHQACFVCCFFFCLFWGT